MNTNILDPKFIVLAILTAILAGRILAGRAVIVTAIVATIASWILLWNRFGLEWPIISAFTGLFWFWHYHSARDNEPVWKRCGIAVIHFCALIIGHLTMGLLPM